MNVMSFRQYAISSSTTSLVFLAGMRTLTDSSTAGFVTTRMNATIANEAMNMYTDGVASMRDIDTSVKLGLNFPMGPFELGDLVGLDTRLRVMEYLHKTLGERYRPNPILAQHVKAGRLGRKSGKGYYDYS
jgi:3-hydroxybutyryl-CoA dehydrogenase